MVETPCELRVPPRDAMASGKQTGHEYRFRCTATGERIETAELIKNNM